MLHAHVACSITSLSLQLNKLYCYCFEQQCIKVKVVYKKGMGRLANEIPRIAVEKIVAKYSYIHMPQGPTAMLVLHHQ